MPNAPVATGYTYDFVREHLPAGATSVLEIGCGAGELAARLQADGLRIVGIDSDEECVATAKAAGVEARQLAWPAPLDERFDAVLFTRSLHHIAPMDEAVAAAVEALKPGGCVILEDFRFERDSNRAQSWFTGLMALLDGAGLTRGGFSIEGLRDRLDFSGHEHELHSSVAIAAALGRCGAVEEQSAAYYFRYGEPHLEEAVTPHLLDYELAMIDADAIDALGARFVLTPAR